MQASELPILKSGLQWRIEGGKASLVRGGKVLGTVEVKNGNTVYSVKGGTRCSIDAVDTMFAGRDLLIQVGVEVVS